MDNRVDRYYILDGTVPVPVDLLAWAQWYETHERHVAETWVTPTVRVSTIFLGLDHQWDPWGRSRPRLFETMIFGGEHDHEQWRWSSWHEAEQGHEAAVAMARAAC